MIHSRVFRGLIVVTISSFSSPSLGSFFLFGLNRSFVLFFGSTRGCFRRDSNVPIPFKGSLGNIIQHMFLGTIFGFYDHFNPLTSCLVEPVAGD